MLEIIFQLIAAFVGTVSFSILFSTPNKYLPQCGLVGALGWGVHLLTLDEVKELLLDDRIKQALHAAPLWKYMAMNHLI